MYKNPLLKCVQQRNMSDLFTPEIFLLQALIVIGSIPISAICYLGFRRGIALVFSLILIWTSLSSDS